jgi:CBS domain-containing protein
MNSSLSHPRFMPELRRLLREIARADHAGLRRAAEAARALEHEQASSAPAAALTRLISALSDALTRRAIALASIDFPPPAARWCWIALGSEGRQEQTFVSDQDNGIVFDDSADPDTLRRHLLPLAGRVNQMLDDCGFAVCPGNIMAGNPACCLSLHEWRERFDAWISEGDPLALLNATIFFDLRPLAGDLALAHGLSAWTVRHAADNQRFLFQMADNALRRRPPLGLLHRFSPEKSGPHAGTIDLKHNAAALFVDAARVLGLACGANACGTVGRLRIAAQRQLLHPAEAADWEGSFHFIALLRLRLQQQRYLRGETMDNHLRPDTLEAGERRVLLHALRAAGAMQQRLSQLFLGGGSGL